MSDTTDTAAARRRWRLIALLTAIGLVIACLLDMPVFRAVQQHPPRWVKHDIGIFLRCGGYLPTWLIAAAAMALHDRRSVGGWCFKAWRRGGMLAASATLAGITAEVTKEIFRRQRPEIANAWYAFRPMLTRPFSSSGLSLPSSHAMVAFGAAFMLCRLLPAATPVWLLLAAGTAVSRVASGAHYVSDVYVAAGLAWAVALLTAQLFDGLQARLARATDPAAPLTQPLTSSPRRW